MFDSVIIQVIIPTLAALGSGLAGWLFGRRKREADAKAAEIGNLDRIVEMWQGTAERFKQTADELMEQNNRISEEVRNLRCENRKLIEDVKRLNTMVEGLKCENKALLRRLNEIKKMQQSHETN